MEPRKKILRDFSAYKSNKSSAALVEGPSCSHPCSRPWKSIKTTVLRKSAMKEGPCYSGLLGIMTKQKNQLSLLFAFLAYYFWDIIKLSKRSGIETTCFSSGGSLLHSLPNILVISGNGTSGLFARSCSRRSFMNRTYPVRGDLGALLSRRGFFLFLPLDQPPRLLLCYKIKIKTKL